MPETPRTVVRFAVVAPDGRRSSEWRVWTGGEGRPPKNDVYLAPAKSIKEFKISLHRDNMAQYGLSDSMRARIRPGDRHAPLRWEMDTTEITPGWRCGYLLRFPEQEHEQLAPCSDDAIKVPAAPLGGEVSIAILIGTPNATLKSDSLGEIIALLDREDGGKVAVVAFRGTFDPALVAELELQESQFGWALPSLVTDREPFGWVVHNHGGTRSSTEFSSLKHAVQQKVVSLAGFNGDVGSIEECPSAIDHRDAACAVLVCGSGGHRLYVDPRGRCSHEHLANDASTLADSYDRGELDEHWGTMPDGSLHTMISTQRVVEEMGISRWGR